MENTYTVLVRYIGENRTIHYAAAELVKYLKLISSQPATALQCSSFESQAIPAIWIGLGLEFPQVSLPAVKDSGLDDAVYIKTKGGDGIIAGNNPRSVLLGIYRYLTELGCRWVRPGSNGEFIPTLDISGTSVDVQETASYRHRGICIEGAVSIDHVKDIIEWAPRLGFNSYFIQFREAFTFFDRWYSHTGNPIKKGEELSVDRAQELSASAVDEIEKRDLLYHAVGHGWTCEPFGISGLGWEYPAGEVKSKVRQYLALIDGKRDFWGGVPLNTNLCYSNPYVRRLVAEEIAGYAKDHPEIDFLHFWLADGSNNNCECEECRKKRPADFYVMMLNEVDELLMKEKLDTRIVFLIYVDLLWPPEKERIRNPERFVLMFAPITRTYSKAFSSNETLPPLPPFNRNRLVMPRNVEENMAFLKAWKDLFSGDSFDFDYHYMWDHYKDPGDTQLANVLHEDVRLLRSINLDGFMSCQTQRAFFPTGLGMSVMGLALWDRKRDFKEIAQDFFYAAFGSDGEQCCEYLTSLSKLFNPVYLRGEVSAEEAQILESLRMIPALIQGFRPVIQRNLRQENQCRALSWAYLDHHADIAEAFARMLEARARGEHAETKRLWEEIKKMVWEKEKILHPVFDVWNFIKTVERAFFEKDKTP
jgi:hypothetical protein